MDTSDWTQKRAASIASREDLAVVDLQGFPAMGHGSLRMASSGGMIFSRSVAKR